MNDPFATAAIRDRVLAAWSASPARFREDANTEEDFALGGYRERLVVELAQNAADAARAAGVPGRVRFTLADPSAGDTGSGGPPLTDAAIAASGDRPVLVVANTGAPLTAAGLTSLATLRASAKRDSGVLDGVGDGVGDGVSDGVGDGVGDEAAGGSTGEPSPVGRFGVGFAAVLTVTDEPAVLSRGGGVRFSREDSAALVGQAAREDPALADELRRRDGHVPALRLPFAADGTPPAGFDTAVVLPLRDDGAVALTRRLLAEIDDPLLLALPDLDRVEVAIDGTERVIADVERRWRVHRTAGTWGRDERARLLADRPTEERDRPSWSVTWALPRMDEVRIPGVVHAPTPTEEPLSLPALLLASFPLDPTRRHVEPGPLTDRVAAEAIAAYTDLVAQRAVEGADILLMVPTGVPAGRVDGVLREGIVAALGSTPCLSGLPGADDGLLRPRDAVALEGGPGADPEVLRVLAPAVGGLVLAPPQTRAKLDALGVRRLALDELVDELRAIAEAHPPTWWRELYAALTPSVTDPFVREALGALPVPLADGRVVGGARGLLLPDASAVPADALGTLAPYGLRVVHPDAVHELLERLGARSADPRTLLDDGAIRSAVANAPDADDPDAIAEAILGLVAGAVRRLRPGELGFLADLALRDDTDELTPASALVLAGSPAEDILDPAEFASADPALASHWGGDVLEAVGVARGLAVVGASDVDLAALPDELADLDDIDAWAGRDGGTAAEVWAVRDLDVVHDWPRALRRIADVPELRQLLIQPVRVRRPEGQTARLTSYTAWWLRRHLRPDGQPVAVLRDPEAEQTLGAVLDPPPAWLGELDSTIRWAVGLPRRFAELDTAGLDLVLARLADPNREVDLALMLALWRQLGEVDPAVLDQTTTSDQVRVAAGDGTAVVDASEAIVIDQPMWLQRRDVGAAVIAVGAAADAVAGVFDLPVASEVAAGRIDGPTAAARQRPTPEAVPRVLSGVASRWWEHDDLRVDGHSVDWWVDDAGGTHAATADGLARGLAWAAGRWRDRHVIAAVLAEPDRAAELLTEMPYESPEDEPPDDDPPDEPSENEMPDVPNGG